MQLILPDSATLSLKTEIYVEHGDQRIPFDVGAFLKKSIDEQPHLFLHINQYLSLLPSNIQNNIFRRYQEVRAIFDDNILTDELDKKLSCEIKEIFDFIDFGDLFRWAQLKSDIRFPQAPMLPVEFVDVGSKTHTREKTYTVSDYMKLIVFILQLRLLVPIWGEYIKAMSKIKGTNYKEFYAFKLIDESNLASGEALTKLTQYVIANVPEEARSSAVMDFISTEDFPIWNLALLVVRRLALTDITGWNDPSPVIIKHTSRHITERVNRSNNNFNNEILRDKVNRESRPNASEENQMSVYENYKIKQDIATGDQMLIKHAVQDPYMIANFLSPNIPPELVEKALEMASIINSSNPAVMASEVKKAQTILLKWIISPVIPAEGVDYLSRQERSKCLCACFAVLWHAGHYLMAGLLTAVEYRQGDNIVSSGIETKGRISSVLNDKLLQYFPFQRKNNSGKLVNVVGDSIENLRTEFARESWLYTVKDPAMLAILNPTNVTSRRVTLPHTFKTSIVELVIWLCEQREIIRQSRVNFK